MAKKRQVKNSGLNNTIEAGKDIVTEGATEFGKTIANDVIKDGGKDFFSQLLGWGPYSESKSRKNRIQTLEDKVNGIEIVNLSNKPLKVDTSETEYYSEKQKKAEVRIEAGIEYHKDILKHSERAFKREVREMDDKMREIMVELRKLISTSKVLQLEFAEVSLDQAPVNIGEYHINFFEWILTVIRAARKKVEDSSAWLESVKGKKSKKEGYWGMFKKHGTTFGLSNERVVATQTG